MRDIRHETERTITKRCKESIDGGRDTDLTKRNSERERERERERGGSSDDSAMRIECDESI